MIEVKISMIPFGVEANRYELGTMTIARQHDTARITDYAVNYNTAPSNNTQVMWGGIIRDIDSNRGIEALVADATKLLTRALGRERLNPMSKPFTFDTKHGNLLQGRFPKDCIKACARAGQVDADVTLWGQQAGFRESLSACATPC